MPNMGYCRFTNTRQALAQCIEGIKNGDISSKTEVAEGKGMLREVAELLQDYGVIDTFDSKAIDHMVEESYGPEYEDDEEND